ncbi:hypothetical protein EDB19DRAFT_1677932 [Suillus lakei]|nr:hypothetical protein EDB19DRAFT_1677932 [Suillus lakei]
MSSDIVSQTGRSSGSASHLFPMDYDDDLDEGGIYDNHLSGRNSQPPSPDHRMVTSHENPLRSVEADGLHRSWVNDSGYADMDTAEIGNVHGSILTADLLDPHRYLSPPSNSCPFSFGSNSQGTEEYILNMDTSPPSSQGSFSQLRGGWSSDHDHFLQQSPSSSTSPIGSPAPIIMHNSPDFFRWDSSTKCSSPRGYPSASGSSAKLRSISQSLDHPSGVKPVSASPFEIQHAHTTPQKAREVFRAAQISEAVVKYSTTVSNTQHRQPFQTSYPATRTEPVEAHFSSSHGFSSFGGSDIKDPGLPLDILNDPDPWATIGKILNLETIEEHVNDDISFTRGREGVGYVRRRVDGTANIRNLPRSSTISPRQVEPDSEDEPKATTNDEAEEYLGENTDHCRHQSRHIEDSQSEERSLPDHFNVVEDTKFAEQNKSLCTSAMADSEMQTESPCIPAALAHRVSPQAVQCSGLDDDEIYGGPCLFGDSDEEDE